MRHNLSTYTSGIQSLLPHDLFEKSGKNSVHLLPIQNSPCPADQISFFSGINFRSLLNNYNSHNNNRTFNKWPDFQITVKKHARLFQNNFHSHLLNISQERLLPENLKVG